MHLARHFHFRSTHVLVDRSENTIEANGGVRSSFGFKRTPGRFAFYSSLECARDILVANGLNRDNIVLVNASAEGVKEVRPRSIDLAISLWSLGWHYSVSAYLPLLAEALRPGAGLLLFLGGNAERMRTKHRDEIIKAGFTCKAVRKLSYQQGGHQNRADVLSCVRAAAI